jgi:hypothetical protein
MRIAVSVLLVAVTGCGVVVDTTLLAPLPPRPVVHHAVELVTCSDRPAHAVALLEATNWPWNETPTVMVASLRARAEALGCDALEIAHFDHEPRGHSVVDAYCLVYPR